MAAICTNGISIAADSRSVLFDNNLKVYAYYEGVKKLYAINNFIIATSGLYDFKNITLEGVLQKFASKYKGTNLPIQNFLTTFFEFSHSLLNKGDYDSLRKNCFLVCGYKNNTPIIYKYKSRKIDSIMTTGFMSNYDFTKQNNQMVNDFLLTANMIKTNTFLSVFLNYKITDENKNEIGKIGGPLSTVNIINNKISWFSNQNKYQFLTPMEYANAYRRGEIKLIYRSSQDSITYKKSMDYFYPVK